MPANHYDHELRQLAHTYAAAMNSDIGRLKAAIAGASESSVIGVGSGGSYTVASLLCNLHEAYTGRVSRPSTPLEVICNPTLASSSPVFLISAEGKNPDIIEALQRARRHSARPVHVFTNRTACPLIQQIERLTDVSTHVFELAEKDGYLATNSLLMDAVLVARAYGELSNEQEHLPSTLDELKIGHLTLEAWAASAEGFVDACVARGSITVLYSPLLKPIAADLESKLAEAALLHSQFADVRSYAHGRHLWLAKRPQDCAILALTEPTLGSLWPHMKTLIPSGIPTFDMDLSGAAPRDQISGLIAQMYLVAGIAKALGVDPARPDVPNFGRDLYYANLQKFIPIPPEEATAPVQAKYDVIGARWPSQRDHGSMVRSREEFLSCLQKQRFRAVVFDYDGTLCSSQRTDSPPPKEVLIHLRRLVEAGVIVGIASGRGGSVQESLAESLPKDVLGKIQLGLYNCGAIGDATTPPPAQPETSEFLSHVTRIVVRLKSLGVPIQEYKVTHPYQVSVRFREGLQTDTMWFVIADALRQAGLDLSSLVKSKHSVDILAAGITKSSLIAHIIQRFKIDPYQVLTIGDQGAWPGNDAALLEHRYSLSVDVPSRRIDRGWKVAPLHLRDVDASLWYLDRFITGTSGSFTIDFAAPIPQASDYA
jgi:HAD superfamily hydrolase (TIGR01484 family)